MTKDTSSRRRRRLWKFSGAEFDEASWALRIDGQVVALEGKPLEVLHELLLRAGEVVTKDEILDAVWPGVIVVEGSLTTAVSKLRKALGERENNVIETVPRVGYRLTCSVRIDSVDSPLAPRFTFSAGDTVPGRPQWKLEQPLGDSGANDVWLGRHAKTGEQRVFKFADAPDRLRGLKREAALSRVLFAGLGKCAPLPALLEWNFETSPYFLEYAYGGTDLVAWAEQWGGLSAIPIAERLAVVASICRAVGQVHDLGVLHKDLKPANILIEMAKGSPAIRLADFGSGRLLDDTVLDSFQITNPGVLDAELGVQEPRSGTLAYRAPELTGDALPTIKSDIYALGLILYQLAVGDFTKALAPGWEDAVPDAHLRADIRQACDGEAARRLASAGELADRIEQLEQRREATDTAERQAAELAVVQEAQARRRQRRPWVRAAVGSLVVGLTASSALGVYAWTQRNQAIAAHELAGTSYSFVAEDVLGTVDPAQASGADETVAEAMKRASANIDRRYADKPNIAARLHLSLARAFYGRSDFDTARREFAQAERLFTHAGESGSDDAVVGRLALAHMNAVSGQPQKLAEANQILIRERARLGSRADSGAVGFALAQAEGAHGFFADMPQAERAFRRAAQIGSAPESNIPATQLLKIRSSLVLVLLRLGRPEEAEALARAVVADSARIRGNDHPDTLVTLQHWLTSLSFLGRHEQVLRESVALLSTTETRFGPDHRMTLTLRSTRFESLSALGRYSEAAHEAERVWRGASAQAGENSHQALIGQTDYAFVLCQTPQKAEAMRIMNDARQRAEASFGPEFPFTHLVRYFTGECALANGRLTEAARIFTSIDRSKLVDISGRPTMGAQVDLAFAEIALGRGDRARASTMFAAAQPVLRETRDIYLRNRLSALEQRLKT